MATSPAQIRKWLEEAKAKGATHVIIACDTFDQGDFPVSVMPGEDPRKKAGEYDNPDKMLRLMEVYSFSRDIEGQLKERRAFHYD